MIVSTYLVFNVTSTILFQVRRYEIKSAINGHCTLCALLYNLAFFFQASGYLSDAIVYIAMQKSVKKLLTRKILPHEHKKSNEMVTESCYPD